MRTIEFSRRFRKDFKALTHSPYRQRAEQRLQEFIDCWIKRTPLAASFRDHALSGRFHG